MSFNKKLALAQEMMETAMSSLRSAQTLLNEINGRDASEFALKDKLDSFTPKSNDAEDGQVYEGLFDGEKMITADGEEFAVPANYASKSKLVMGDELKLVIGDDGRFIYKQIGPAERRHIIGTLIREENKYKVMAEGKLYNVLTAAVTYYKGEVGDKVTLVVPADGDCQWGAVDNVIPESGLDDIVGLDDSEVF